MAAIRRLLAAAALLPTAAAAGPATAAAAGPATCGEDRHHAACKASQQQASATAPGVVLIQKPGLARVTRGESAQLATQTARATMADVARHTGSLAQREASTSSLMAKGTVEVVSYNLFWWNVGANNRWDELFARIRGERPFDLIGFQECNDVAHVVKSSGLEGFDYFQGPGSNPCPLAWNSAVFERLEEPQSMWVAKDMWGDRHMTWVRLRHKPTGASVFFANTHGPLQNCGDELGDNWLSGVKANMQPDDVAFMTGDFNCVDNTLAVKKVKELLENEVDGGIDHIITNVEVVSGGPKSGQPSDHPLLRGEFRFSPQKVSESVVSGGGGPAPAPAVPSPAGASPSSSPASSPTPAGEGGCGKTEENVDYSGANLGSEVVFTDDALECSRLCRDTAGCESFTFGRGSQACYLKRAAQPGRREDDCCISGLPACSEDDGSTTAAAPASSTTAASEGLPASSTSTTAAASSTTVGEKTAQTTPLPEAAGSTTEAAGNATSTSGAGAEDAFVLHGGFNCWKDNGADPLPDRDMIGNMTLSACKAECESEPACEGVVVFHEESPGNCWLRQNVDLDVCQGNTPWDLWLKA